MYNETLPAQAGRRQWSVLLPSYLRDRTSALPSSIQQMCDPYNPGPQTHEPTNAASSPSGTTKFKHRRSEPLHFAGLPSPHVDISRESIPTPHLKNFGVLRAPILRLWPRVKGLPSDNISIQSSMSTYDNTTRRRANHPCSTSNTSPATRFETTLHSRLWDGASPASATNFLWANANAKSSVQPEHIPTIVSGAHRGALFSRQPFLREAWARRTSRGWVHDKSEHEPGSQHNQKPRSIVPPPPSSPLFPCTRPFRRKSESYHARPPPALISPCQDGTSTAQRKNTLMITPQAATSPPPRVPAS